MDVQFYPRLNVSLFAFLFLVRRMLLCSNVLIELVLKIYSCILNLQK